MRMLLGLVLVSFLLTGCQTTSSGLNPSSKKYAVLEVKDGENTREILGYIMDASRLGHDLPIAFYSLTGKQMCSGTYTMLQRMQQGAMKLNCFDGRMKSEGQFHVTAKRGSVSTGIATLHTAREEIRVVFGLTERELIQRKVASKGEQG